jgi:hypothetical protein
MANSEVVLVREFDSDLFHKKVMELESQGYVANRETYKIVADMDPETGKLVHLHTIELSKA